MSTYKWVAKAVHGAVIAGLGALVVALEDQKIDLSEGLTAASVALVAFGVVYFSGPDLPKRG